jgi:hypothetical protein
MEIFRLLGEITNLSDISVCRQGSQRLKASAAAFAGEFKNMVVFALRIKAAESQKRIPNGSQLVARSSQPPDKHIKTVPPYPSFF